MDTFPDIFDRFADKVLPQAMTDAALLRIRSLARIDRVAREGLAPLAQDIPILVFMASGAAKLVAHAAAGREQVVGFYFAGDLLMLPADPSHGHALYGLTSCSMLIMPYREVREIARAEAALANSLLDLAEGSLVRLREKAVTLGRKSASERIAAFLLSMIGRAGKPCGGQIILDLPMSRRDIADSLGLTIETVSRQITLLRDEGLIATSGRSQIVLLDPKRLESRAGYTRQAA